ncbi:hypothetical protein BV898_11564 [Hypsibius exemplaris]|uniref:Uncharacterized protein n=1 Tax=Hypsibius exemplaris TaxID=2072580 RepID=A0A1W0WG90_HYPEX|nr:hypothetical protein BV898_11564 [Hypsibius exemplaris]
MSFDNCCNCSSFRIGNRGKQYVNLCATLLLEVNAADIALKLLRYCQNILTGYSFRSAETCYLLGNIYEDLAASKKDHSVNYVDKARQAYQESLVFRPSYRDAKYRLCYLEGDFPTVLSFSLTPKRKKEHAAEQCTLYLAYLAAHVNGDSSAIVDAAKNCILSTFRFVLPPRPDDFIWCLNTPYALLTATKRKRASCQLLAMDDRGVRYWHQNVTPQAWLDMALTGCTVAYQEKRYDDMVEIAFYAILTAELHEPAAKTVVMDDKSSSLVRVSDRQWQLSRVHLAIAVAAFHMRPAWEMNDSDDRPTWTDRKAFFYDYIRVLVNRHGAMDLAVDLWNPFYALIMDEAVVPNIAVGKWGHFFTKKKGFSMHVQMILANDALRRRGAAYHAYTLYRGIEQSMGKHTPWQVYLGLGILAVNVACRFGMSRKLRAKFYASSMAYLMKYEQLRRSCPEVLYNKARAAQEFGDAAVAVGYYRQCIRLTDLTVCTGDGLELAGVAQLMDYKFRAAFNLRQLLVEKARFVEARALMTTGGPLSWKSFTDGKTAHSRC